MKEDILWKLNILYSVTGLPLTLVEEAGNIQASFPSGNQKYFMPSNFKELLQVIHTENPKSEISIANLCAGFSCAIIKLKKYLYLIIGPASAISLKTQNIIELINHYIPTGMAAEFLSMIMSSPRTSYIKLQNIAAMAKYIFTQRITLIDTLSSESIGSYFIGQENLYSLQQMEQVSLSVPIDDISRNYSNQTQFCCNYINQHFHEKINLNILAELTFLNRGSLSYRFRSETGMSIQEYTSRKRLEEAKYLLANTPMALSDISAYLQYSTQSYFTVKFKQYCNVTPQQWRDGIR
ncbi:AraC-type DNA-binding protein [Anaerocolumna jejuensis DSM 15929]|uniref:AraC-type DNA-binding protein n=1 Tax=Anaerocolumna jejuensis DSM 15929 TaxID=1121322 RepID=A0A1M7BUN5_9FIRM|nr:AraC family transcriptional regulator [Anaerocolumna jejuensis]SHL58623.1 AraC-type DNA-binding protein [Anaerocolumna jejuensis DSM 15929]